MNVSCTFISINQSVWYFFSKNITHEKIVIKQLQVSTFEVKDPGKEYLTSP